MELFVFLVLWALLAWGISALAISRGRSGVGFFLLSFLLSPILGLIVVLVMSNVADDAAKAIERRRDEENRERIRREEHERQLESIKAIAVPLKSDTTRSPAPSIPSLSVADEIRKLGLLRTEGLLTDAEFQSQKSHLLSMPTHRQPVSPQVADAPAPAPVPTQIERNGICPNCNATIPLLSKACPRCTASFTDGSTWSVRPI